MRVVSQIHVNERFLTSVQSSNACGLWRRGLIRVKYCNDVCTHYVMNLRPNIKWCFHFHSVIMYAVRIIGLRDNWTEQNQKSKLIHLVHLCNNTMLIWLNNHLWRIYISFKKLSQLITDISQLSQSQTGDYTNWA